MAPYLSLMLTVRGEMTEKKNFLILAIGMGVIGVIIGGITIWNLVN
ncbi:MAG: hypothetical protein PVI88_06100 [Nitrosopumilaceae archaeon]